jgi:hypothetical protein
MPIGFRIRSRRLWISLLREARLLPDRTGDKAAGKTSRLIVAAIGTAGANGGLAR